jgi:leader peptidase (prepilin peptidase)/N-methyltransferase
MNALAAITDAALCTASASLGIAIAARICKNRMPFADGPPAGRVSVPLLLALAGTFGALVSAAKLDLAHTGVIVILCGSLVAIWYSDVRCGIVPDVFTLGPLALIITVALVSHEWWAIASCAIVAVAFGITALVSRGRGMGWGDVKLAALGGAVLGLDAAVLSCVAACLVAGFIALIRGRIHRPIAFAPYLVAAFALSLVWSRL